ncbi:MAG: hypothetical protein LC676_06070 [Loktanella sp.]|nr:hypothetical protein [Loktanella sp.]
MTAPLLVIDHVSKRFPLKATLADKLAARLAGRRAGGAVHAVTDVSLTVASSPHGCR